MPFRLVPPPWEVLPWGSGSCLAACAVPGGQGRSRATVPRAVGQGLPQRRPVAGVGSRCARNNGAPGIDRTTLAEVEEYGVTRLLDELADELQAGAVSAVSGAAGVDPEAGHGR